MRIFNSNSPPAEAAAQSWFPDAILAGRASHRVTWEWSQEAELGVVPLLPDHTEDDVVIGRVDINSNIKERTSGELENVWKLKIL